MQSTILTNELTFKTFNYLKINESRVDIPELKKINLEMESDKVNDILLNNFFENKNNQLPQDVLDLNKKYNNLFKSFKADGKDIKESIKIITSDDENQVIDNHYIEAENGGKLNLIIDYENVGDKEKFRSSLLKIHAKKASTINLFIIQNENTSQTSLETIYLDIDEDAKVNVSQFELGAKKIYTYMQANLLGKHSALNINSIYLGSKKDEINMLYNVFHYGKYTQSDIMVNGALQDQAKKTFKSTLDFKEGSSFSEGSEEEYVILLDEDVESISAPVLLTHEDNVIGNHAASAGNVDQNLMFYIMSRGFDEENAKSLIIQSKFSGAINSIYDEEFRNMLWHKIFDIVRGTDNAK